MNSFFKYSYHHDVRNVSAYKEKHSEIEQTLTNLKPLIQKVFPEVNPTISVEKYEEEYGENWDSLVIRIEADLEKKRNFFKKGYTILVN